MILHWLTTAWRSLIANPLFSLITIASLSIGCCGALLAGANIKQHLSFEQNFAHSERIVLVRMRDGPNPASKHPLAQGNTPVPEGTFNYWLRPAIKPLIDEKLPDVEAMTRVLNLRAPLVEENGEPTKDEGVMVDRSFFDVFEHRFIEGSKETAFAAPDSLVLTRSRARELFGAEAAIGKTLRGPNNTSLRVSGVVEDPPQPTMFNYTVISPIPETGPLATSMASFTRGQTGGLYIRIKAGADRKAFIAHADNAIRQAYFVGLETMVAGGNEMAAAKGMPPFTLAEFYVRVSAMPLRDIHLAPREATGVTSTGEISMLWALGAAALALLAVSAFNYVVLSLARALRRRREVGLRKVLGASNNAVTRHYLAEAGLVTAISLALGFALAELLQPWFARTLGQPEILFNLYDAAFLGGTASAFVLLVFAVGAYPALYLANTRPRTGLEVADDGGGGGGGVRRYITGGLATLQIAAATVLLSVALTMVAQAQYVAARPLGFNTANLYSIEASCLPRGTPVVAINNLSCTATLNRLAHETPGLKRIAWSSNPGIFMTGDPLPITVPGRPNGGGQGFQMAVDAGFLPLTGAKLLAGRLFDVNSGHDRVQMDAYPTYPRERFDSVPVVVTRAMLPVLDVGEPQEAIGKRFMIGASLWTRSYEIVGVIEDWHQRSLKFSVSPIVFIPGGTMMNVVAEIDEADVPSVRESLSPLGGYAGNPAPFRITVTPLSNAFQEAYAADRNLMSAVIGFAALAILVACLGVYGLAALDMRRRIREVGIRKALGAAPGRVAGMMFWRQMRSAILASLLAWPVAWWIANGWLEGYAYRTPLGPVVLLAASAIVVAFVALAVGFNTVRAAVIRPGLALRTAT